MNKKNFNTTFWTIRWKIGELIDRPVRKGENKNKTKNCSERFSEMINNNRKQKNRIYPKMLEGGLLPLVCSRQEVLAVGCKCARLCESVSKSSLDWIDFYLWSPKLLFYMCVWRCRRFGGGPVLAGESDDDGVASAHTIRKTVGEKCEWKECFFCIYLWFFFIQIHFWLHSRVQFIIYLFINILFATRGSGIEFSDQIVDYYYFYGYLCSGLKTNKSHGLNKDGLCVCGRARTLGHARQRA